MTHVGPVATCEPQRGSIILVTTILALVIACISVTMLAAGFSSQRMHSRADGCLYALEAAETGIARAEQEVASQTDPGGDGIGNVSGTYAGSSFTVTATQDPVVTNRWRLLARGWNGSNSRRIEVCARLVPDGPWSYGVFGKISVGFGGSGSSTDSYDSRLGTYSSQATHIDSVGAYAEPGGSIGSNGSATLSTSVRIRGNVNAGPGQSPSLSSTATVTGDLMPLTDPLNVPTTPYSEFLSAATTNNNGAWTVTGGLYYDSFTKSLAVGGGNTITLTGAKYFFSRITLTGGSTLKITSGPVKIYVTDEIAFSGGKVANMTGKPVNLQIYQNPYALPAGVTPWHNSATLSGGSDSAFVLYAPNSAVTVSGGGAIFGACVAGTYSSTSSSQVHYDVALRDQLGGGHSRIQRLYWRDLASPQR